MTFLIIDYTTDLKIIRVKGLHCPYYYWQVYQDYELRKKSKYSLPRAKHLFSHHELFCFCDMLDRRKVLSLISYLEWCQRSSPSQISCKPQKGFELAQNLGSGLFQWICAIVITIIPHRHFPKKVTLLPLKFFYMKIIYCFSNIVNVTFYQNFKLNIAYIM